MYDTLPPPRLNSAAVFIVGLALRIWLIHAYPIVFGGDSVLRLANRDHIFLSYQLPLLQVLIYGVSLISQSLLVVRCLMAIIGAAAGIGFYWMMRCFVSERPAFVTALLFSANPFLVEISIVPYQELLMLAGLLFAFQYFFRERKVAAGCSLAVACLARYEAWIAIPLLSVARARNATAMARAFLLFGWAPLVWVLIHVGLSGPGTFVIEWPASPGRLMRWVYLGWITLKNTPAPVLALALAGTWQVFRLHLLKDVRVRLLAGFLGLFLTAILFSSHGVSPDPERFVASREATILIAATLGLAAWGLEKMFMSPHSWLAGTLVLLGLTWSVVDVHRLLRRDTADPHLQLSYQLAQYLDRSAEKEENILILVKPLQVELGREYLDKVRRRQGEAGVARAKQIMAGMDISPPDCQRTIIHSRIGKPRMACAGDPADKEWIAVWSDSGATIPTGTRALRATLRSGPLSVQVYR